MLRRLHQEQPEDFAFTAANRAWAEAQVTKYPAGRQASAVIPLLWRAQEQEGWLTRPAIEHVAEMLGMPYMRALEVASFYFMFQLQPVGSVAHIQICGTTSCMICGAEDLVGVCKEKIAPRAHELSADGKLSWEEVECLGACANAPMAQIGKDYYEDLTTDRLAEILEALTRGEVPRPGPQAGRFASEPANGLTSLTDQGDDRLPANASVALAQDQGDTIKRIDGTEVPLVTPWTDRSFTRGDAEPERGPEPAADHPADRTGIDKRQAPEQGTAHPRTSDPARAAESAPRTTERDTGPDVAPGLKPAMMEAPRDGAPDDLKRIKGIGPKLEEVCHSLGVFHFDQIASWTDEEIAWVDQNLEGFRGRVSRDDWVAQAKTLASGGETEFSSRVDKGDAQDE